MTTKTNIEVAREIFNAQLPQRDEMGKKWRVHVCKLIEAATSCSVASSAGMFNKLRIEHENGGPQPSKRAARKGTVTVRMTPEAYAAAQEADPTFGTLYEILNAAGESTNKFALSEGTAKTLASRIKGGTFLEVNREEEESEG